MTKSGPFRLGVPFNPISVCTCMETERDRILDQNSKPRARNALTRLSPDDRRASLIIYKIIRVSDDNSINMSGT